LVSIGRLLEYKGAPIPSAVILMLSMEHSPDSPAASARALAEAETERELKLVQPVLHAYVGSLILGGGDAESVADIVQEANLLIWDKREEYATGTNFKAWAFRIAYFKALSHRRDASRRGKFVFNDELLLQLASDAEDRFQNEANARGEALSACVAELPPEQRELLEQHYLDGVSLTDIAYRGGRKPAALHKTISRIRLALRSCVNRRLGE
jgi:RNA polymerase sigma-70 factor (ECF subfamily)